MSEYRNTSNTQREKDIDDLMAWINSLPDENWEAFYRWLVYIANHPEVLVLAMKLHETFHDSETEPPIKH